MPQIGRCAAPIHARFARKHGHVCWKHNHVRALLTVSARNMIVFRADMIVSAGNMTVFRAGMTVSAGNMIVFAADMTMSAQP
jgi:hypothetical protein